MRPYATMCVAILFAITSARTWCQIPFSVGTITAREGGKEDGYLSVPAGHDGEAQIPVTVFHGKMPGPTIVISAGIHGTEYAPITAVRHLVDSIDPGALRGNIIFVLVANPPSFFGRAIYYSPADHLNPNRAFPGKTDGTLTERIAWTLANQVVAKCDYLVDIHAGEANESLIPYVAYGTDMPQIQEASRQMALAFGFHVVKTLSGRPTDPRKAGSLSNYSATLNKPTIGIESGDMGESTGESVERIERGVMSLLRHLKMISGAPLYSDHPLLVSREQAVLSPKTGLFAPSVTKGALVRKGTVLGYVTDVFGKDPIPIEAPFDGLVTYLVVTPPISKGEVTVSIVRLMSELPEDKGSSSSTQ